jgi:hypothetical protein
VTTATTAPDAPAAAAAAAPDLGRLSRALARLLRIPEPQMPSCLVAAGEPDLDGIVRMRREVLGDEITWDDQRYLRWRYRLDGAPVEAIGGGGEASRLWLFKHGAEIKGCLGAEEVAVAAGGGQIRALRFMDLMVLPRLNGIGIGAWMNLRLLERVEVGISIGGSDQSIGMIGRLFHRMPDRLIWSLPVHTGPFLAARWPWTRRLPAASRLLDMGLAARRLVTRTRTRAHARGRGRAPLEVIETPEPDPSIAALCDTMAARAGLVLVPRTAARWRWRYLENPRRRYRLFAARSGGRTVAALAAREKGEVAELVDWLWDGALDEPDARGVLVGLLGTAIERLAAGGASRVRALTYDALSADVCRQLGMFPRGGRAAYAVRARPAAREAELTAGPWFVTLGDSDGD